MPLTPTDTPNFPPIRLRGDGCIFAHTRPIDKSGVPKEAQDDALSDGMSGDHQTPPGRPTKDDAASIAYLFLAAVLLGTRRGGF
jgi:hypothetical protein